MGRSSPDSVVRALVANAADFVDRAMDDLDESPKYAAIHFYAGVEIFLKARLATEHWALVFEDPRSANKDQFIRGDFRSVGLDEAINRLHNVTGRPVPPPASAAFKVLQGRRNRLVHFADPASGDIEDIVSEQLRAWYELQLLLTRTWKAEFAPHSDTVERIDSKMHGQRRFLEHKAERVAGDLEKIRQRGGILYPCPACGFVAVRAAASFGDLEFGHCLVCQLDDRWLCFTTDEGERVRLGEGARPLDPVPETVPEIGIDDLIEAYATSQSPEDRLGGPASAYCGTCELTEMATVVPWEPGRALDSWEPYHGTPAPPLWLCLNCLDTPDVTQRCEWCGEHVSGEVGDYWTPRCVRCAYHIEQHSR